MIEVSKKYYNLRKVNRSPKKEKKNVFFTITYGFIPFIILKLFSKVLFYFIYFSLEVKEDKV